MASTFLGAVPAPPSASIRRRLGWGLSGPDHATYNVERQSNGWFSFRSFVVYISSSSLLLWVFPCVLQGWCDSWGTRSSLCRGWTPINPDIVHSKTTQTLL